MGYPKIMFPVEMVIGGYPRFSDAPIPLIQGEIRTLVD